MATLAVSSVTTRSRSQPLSRLMDHGDISLLADFHAPFIFNVSLYQNGGRALLYVTQHRRNHCPSFQLCDRYWLLHIGPNVSVLYGLQKRNKILM